MRKVFICIVIAGLACMLSTPVFAQGMVAMKATITKMQGEVLVTKTGTASARQAAIGDVLGSGDQVDTKAGGAVQIKMDNGNTINMCPNSQIILSRLASNTATGEYENLMESNFGTIRANVSAKVRGKSAFRIKTPTAISGARGTVFYLVITETWTRIFVTEAEADFTNVSTGDTFIIVEGMTALAAAAGSAAPVEVVGSVRDEVLKICGCGLVGEDEYEEYLREKLGTVPEGPSQVDSPQTPTDNPPPSQS